MLWIKAFHIIFMVTWFSGLFYLPRLFVYHSLATARTSIDRFKIMERKLYYGIATPGAVFTLLCGVWLMHLEPYYAKMQWLQWKVMLVLVLIVYHLYLGKILYSFKNNRNKHSHVFYRWLNEVPVVFLFLIVALVVLKPF